jgi:hypothetical protein
LETQTYDNTDLYNGVRTRLDVAIMLTPRGGGKTKVVEGALGFAAPHDDDAARGEATRGDDVTRAVSTHADDAGRAARNGGQAAESATSSASMYPGNNPNTSPGEGFEWRGNGNPDSGRGNWHNPTTAKNGIRA